MRHVRGGQVQHPAARHQEPGGPGLGAERPAAQVSAGTGGGCPGSLPELGKLRHPCPSAWQDPPGAGTGEPPEPRRAPLLSRRQGGRGAVSRRREPGLPLCARQGKGGKGRLPAGSRGALAFASLLPGEGEDVQVRGATGLRPGLLDVQRNVLILFDIG